MEVCGTRLEACVGDQRDRESRISRPAWPSALDWHLSAMAVTSLEMRDDRRYFILAQSADSEYQDQEGTAYHYPLTIANAKKIQPGDFFVYYRPGNGEDDRYFFGHGRIDQVVPGPNNDATALVGNYLPFKSQVPRLVFGSDLRRSSQHSISLIDRTIYDRLVRQGMTEEEQPALYVLTASGPAARAHYAETIAKPLDQALLRQHLPGELAQRLDLANLRAWGALPGPRNSASWNQMKDGDWVITYWNRAYHDSTRVVAKLENESLAEALWGRDPTSGETWRFMYLLEPPRPLEVQAASATEWLPSSYQGFARISTTRVHNIVRRFGSLRNFIDSNLGIKSVAEARPKPYLTFQEQVERVHDYISSTGYVIELADLANFINCLRVKPFVILAGVSGIGKSRLVRVFGDAIGAQYEVIPVQPNWTDSSDLFGYVDPVSRKLIPGRCTTALRVAEALAGQPYLLCLDEMNLAHVEYYFADFLSVLESRQLDNMDRIISDDLLGNLRAQLGVHSEGSEEWPKLQFPRNAFVIGTVNMDETTHPFSRKVLDRANTIELTSISLRNVIPSATGRMRADFDWEFLLPSAVTLSDIYDEDRTFFDNLINELSALNSALEPLNQHFAYRVRDEICLYGYFAKDLPDYLPPAVAIDFQILQKILPRIHGSTEATRRALERLYSAIVPRSSAIGPDRFDLRTGIDEAQAATYPRTAKKLALMLDRFQTDGFTSFWL